MCVCECVWYRTLNVCQRDKERERRHVKKRKGKRERKQDERRICFLLTHWECACAGACVDVCVCVCVWCVCVYVRVCLYCQSVCSGSARETKSDRRPCTRPLSSLSLTLTSFSHSVSLSHTHTHTHSLSLTSLSLSFPPTSLSLSFALTSFSLSFSAPLFPHSRLERTRNVTNTGMPIRTHPPHRSDPHTASKTFIGSASLPPRPLPPLQSLIPPVSTESLVVVSPLTLAPTQMSAEGTKTSTLPSALLTMVRCFGTHNAGGQKLLFHAAESDSCCAGQRGGCAEAQGNDVSKAVALSSHQPHKRRAAERRAPFSTLLSTRERLECVLFPALCLPQPISSFGNVCDESHL